VLVYARVHTQTTWVLDVGPGVGWTHVETEESRSTKAQYTCRQYMCTKYICLYRYLHIYMYMFIYVYKYIRCDDNQQTTVTLFGENKRLHLESSKQNYYIISL